MREIKNVAVLGGGAAGFFAALSAKAHHPNANVSLYEKSTKVLAKVKISGGGRCNVTNSTKDIDLLCKAYPRGGKKLRNLFYRFNTSDTQAWFESRNVPLNTEADGRVFPVSNQSQSIIDCLLKEAKDIGVTLHYNEAITSLKKKGDQWNLFFKNKKAQEDFDAIIVATGGSPKISGFKWLETLDHEIVSPVPSLFTFNMPHENITQLMGVVVKNAHVKIKGHSIEATGPLLITHWGMSGPAILKGSSFGAASLAACQYQFELLVNWMGERNTTLLFGQLQAFANQHPKKSVLKQKAFQLPLRLWQFLVKKNGIPPTKKWIDLSKKETRKFVECLANDTYTVSGKTTFKEEFVTCGGVSLSSIYLQTMESKSSPGLYFAGEVLNIDGITGGYNFQAAWTTGFVAGQLK
ncbi:MAG: putative Rossmann fold flavoprotein [Flavobacteriaceae bacterium]|jgi:predicted Rossmann fold flavoprotein|tara:strand:+ start:9285 stop:10508 length:1224 start_codon:yes stop_codon:yes gene_type:complete